MMIMMVMMMTMMVIMIMIMMIMADFEFFQYIEYDEKVIVMVTMMIMTTLVIQLQIFKLKEHVARLYYSANVLNMEIPYTQENMCDAIVNLIKVCGLEEGYIRPLAYYGAGPLRVLPGADFPIEVIIACWPWGAYLAADAIDMVVSEYIRIHPKSSVMDAKICGHYVNSLLAAQAIQGTRYHEALFLDAEGYVAEGSADNFFIVRDGQLVTTPKGTILEGITRNTILQIARAEGIPVSEELFKPEDVYSASEAFVCGTAVEVTAVRSLDDKLITDGEVGSITRKIRDIYSQIVRGELDEYAESLTPIV